MNRRDFLARSAAVALVPAIPKLPAATIVRPLYGTSPAMIVLPELREYQLACTRALRELLKRDGGVLQFRSDFLTASNHLIG